MADPNRWTYLCAGSVKIDGLQQFARLVFTTSTPIKAEEDISGIEDMMAAMYKSALPPPLVVEAVMLWTTLLRRWYEPDAPARAEPQPS